MYRLKSSYHVQIDVPDPLFPRNGDDKRRTRQLRTRSVEWPETSPVAGELHRGFLGLLERFVEYLQASVDPSSTSSGGNASRLKNNDFESSGFWSSFQPTICKMVLLEGRVTARIEFHAT